MQLSSSDSSGDNTSDFFIPVWTSLTYRLHDERNCLGRYREKIVSSTISLHWGSTNETPCWSSSTPSSSQRLPSRANTSGPYAQQWNTSSSFASNLIVSTSTTHRPSQRLTWLICSGSLLHSCPTSALTWHKTLQRWCTSNSISLKSFFTTVGPHCSANSSTINVSPGLCSADYVAVIITLQ